MTLHRSAYRPGFNHRRTCGVASPQGEECEDQRITFTTGHSSTSRVLHNLLLQRDAPLTILTDARQSQVQPVQTARM